MTRKRKRNLSRTKLKRTKISNSSVEKFARIFCRSFYCSFFDSNIYLQLCFMLLHDFITCDDIIEYIFIRLTWTKSSRVMTAITDVTVTITQLIFDV